MPGGSACIAGSLQLGSTLGSATSAKVEPAARVADGEAGALGPGGTAGLTVGRAGEGAGEAVQAASTTITTSEPSQWASDDPNRRFVERSNLVADPAFLLVAWRRVRGNRGARTASIDGQTAYSIEAAGDHDEVTPALLIAS
jgi:hypothetical protein